MLAEDIRKIIADYKAAQEEAHSEYARQNLKIQAFDEILHQVEAWEKVEKEKATLKSLKEEKEDAISEARAEAHLLDEREEYNAWRGE